MRGCSSQGANQGVKSSSNWGEGPGRALLGPWPGLLVKLPRMALAIAASSFCRGKIGLCVLPPADATGTEREMHCPTLPAVTAEPSSQNPGIQQGPGEQFSF